jgi:hypothetical protein
MLNFPESMEQKEKWNNLWSLFGVEKIPRADQLRNVLDGTGYFSSEELHGEHCLRMEKKDRKGETHTLYYHDMVAAAMVKPGKSVVVFPLIPEFIRNTTSGMGRNRRTRYFACLTCWRFCFTGSMH